jgi:hypothetical protein
VVEPEAPNASYVISILPASVPVVGSPTCTAFGTISPALKFNDDVEGAPVEESARGWFDDGDVQQRTGGPGRHRATGHLQLLRNRRHERTWQPDAAGVACVEDAHRVNGDD